MEGKNSTVIEFGLAENSSNFWIHVGERYVVTSREEAGQKEISQIKKTTQTNKKT